MPRTKSTKSDISNHNPLFPSILVGRKLKPTKFIRRLNRYLRGDPRNDLEEYLQNQDPQDLINAISKDERILQNFRSSFKDDVGMSELFNKPDPKDLLFVDESTIVWESIYYWQSIIAQDDFIWDITDKGVKYRNPNEAEAKELLKKIGAALIPYRKKGIELETNDGLVHGFPFYKGSKAYLDYANVEEFLIRFENVKDVFKIVNKRPKKLNINLEEKEKKNDAIKAFRMLEEIPSDYMGKFIEYIDDFKPFTSNLSIPSKKASYYICLVHGFICKMCRKNKNIPGHDTVYNLYRRAKNEIKK